MNRNRTLIGVAAVLALAAVGAFLLTRTEPQSLQSAQTGAAVAVPPDTAVELPAAAVPTAATSEPAQAEAPAPAMSEAPASETQAATAPAPAQVAAIPKAAEAEATSESQPAAPQVGAVPPSFDIVRVEPSGEAVIPGRAAPGSEVILRAGNRVLGTVVANGSGQWVLVLEKPLEPGSHELSLESRLPGGPTLLSENVVVVSVPRSQIATADPEAPAQPEAMAQPAPSVGADQAASAVQTTEAAPAAPAAPTTLDPVATQDTRDMAAAPPAITEPAAEAQAPAPLAPSGTGSQGETALVAEAERPLAVLMPRDGGGRIRILQQGESVGGGLGEGPLILETVDYDAQGRAQVGGRAEPKSRLVIYLDNKPAADTEAALNGRWEATLTGSITPGLHTLRVDQLTSDGQVAARVETPFSRAAVLAALPGESAVVVQPGNSLWRISRRVYGEGVRYSVIYQANQDQIGDPDLIYPGQIFMVPPTN